ncbi:MAG: hypothetical protein LC796_01730 [Acidobacteria bacterium]|nr:hypothetical protein [Acidobacteriota bacterium]MCA1611163.1 hypothetical protein [Acidobacteriota bacterium]
MTHTQNGRPGGDQAPGVRVSEVFRRALPAIRAALEEYRVPASAAASVETDLAAWLIRFARRNRDASPEAQTLALVSLACSFGRGYQARISETDTPDRKIASLLAENPEAVAARISAGFGCGPSMAPARLDLWTRMRALARRDPDKPRSE